MSRGSYNQTLGQANLITTDSLFPDFASAKVATPAANSFLAVSMSPEPRNPYVQQWSLGVQRSLTQKTPLEFQRGFPMTITASDLGGLNDSQGANRADLVGTPGLTKTIDQWFDTSAFRQPASTSSAPRSSFNRHRMKMDSIYRVFQD